MLTCDPSLASVSNISIIAHWIAPLPSPFFMPLFPYLPPPVISHVPFTQSFHISLCFLFCPHFLFCSIFPSVQILPHISPYFFLCLDLLLFFFLIVLSPRYFPILTIWLLQLQLFYPALFPFPPFYVPCLSSSPPLLLTPSLRSPFFLPFSLLNPLLFPISSCPLISLPLLL